jgi:hypothetical protein
MHSQCRLSGASSAANSGMGYESSRRCALWVSPEVLAAADELAGLLAVDVDTFIETAVLVLFDQEAAEGRLPARAPVPAKSPNGRVVPMAK